LCTAEVRDGEGGTPESDARTHRTPKALRAKIHAKRLAGFREALGVRERPCVAFNRVLRLLNEILGESAVGGFAKKSESFGFSAFQFLRYHPMFLKIK
jgi:hypothetical protein